MRVLVAGGVFGVLMFLSGAISHRESVTRLWNVAWLAFGSLLFGLMTVFEWRVLLHSGIRVVVAIAIIGLFVAALAERRARKRTEVASKMR
jgi:hypothetical protein